MLIKGTLIVTVDGTTHTLGPGEAILRHPGEREFYLFSSEMESTHTWCQVSQRSLSVTERRRLSQVRGVYSVPPVIHSLIEEGLAAGNHDSAVLHEAMRTLARACLLRFAAHASSYDRRNTFSPLHPALQRALEIAATHFVELRSAEDLARRANISASRLRVLFRNSQGESPSAMIWRLKVEHAIQLIRSTGLTLSEIAEECGYANSFHLSRSVRRKIGQSPRSLRQAEWKRTS